MLNNSKVFLAYRDLNLTLIEEYGNTELNVGEWYHIAVVLDTDNYVKFYLNGQHDGTVALSTELITERARDSIFIGKSGNSNPQYVDGHLSNLLVLDDELTEQKIFELYNSGKPKQPWQYSQSLRDSMVLALPLNDAVASGRELEDYSGNENDATTHGGASLKESGLEFEEENLVHNSFSFDGVDDYIDIVNSPSLSLLSGLTLSIWYSTEDTSIADHKYNPLITRRNSSHLDWQLTHVLHSSDSHKFRFDQNGTQFNSNGTYSNENEFYHIVVTYDESDVKIYINGKLDSSFISDNALTDIADKISIGQDNTGSPHFSKASLSMPMVFNRALSDSEIQILYNQNLPKAFSSLPSSITSSAVLAYEMSSNDASLTDLSGSGNNGTTRGGAVANGSELDFEDSPALFEPVIFTDLAAKPTDSTLLLTWETSFAGDLTGYNIYLMIN